METLPGTGDDVGQTVIYRDTWGIPHIYAPTVEQGLYAMGRAQAEDRPEQLLINIKMALGEYASIVGKSITT
jgi:acyl-homoserine lactone acylase PvdQ